MYSVTRQTQESKKKNKNPAPLILSQDALTFMSWWRALSVPGIWRFLEATVTSDRFEAGVLTKRLHLFAPPASTQTQTQKPVIYNTHNMRDLQDAPVATGEDAHFSCRDNKPENTA